MRLLRPLLLASIFVTGVAYAQSTPPASGEVRFVAINENALLSSRLMGLDVHNEGRELLGKIEDVVFEGGQLVGIVLNLGHGSAPDARESGKPPGRTLWRPAKPPRIPTSSAPT